MRKPDQTPDGQPVDHAPEVDSKRVASVTHATEISMLKPLGEQNVLLTLLLGYGSSWYVRLLTAAVGTLGMMAAVMVSAILIGINEPLPDHRVATNESTDIEYPGPINFDSFSPIRPSSSDPLESARTHLRAELVRPVVRLADYRPQRKSRSSSRLRVRKFVPTTLVIYAENGVIKKRVEPWL